ncbi:DUF6115 domain-containing protein [Selenomonas sp.]|uniref:DUF6115 domain-containing protein n=1 Tax=Selenomonas sp. TaxID=2053611 RepID=UPI003FA1ADFF
MITEILGALIVLGAVLVLVMRRLLHKGKGKEQESVEVSASRLRYEIERSGDAVIGRMQIHVERLERILAEANAQKAALDERLNALAQWEKVYGAQLGALPAQMNFAAAPPAAAQQTTSAAQSRTAHQMNASLASQQTVGAAAPMSSATSPVEEATNFHAALMEQMTGRTVGGSIDLQLHPEEWTSPDAAKAADYDRAAARVEGLAKTSFDAAHTSMAVDSYAETEEEEVAEAYEYPDADEIEYAAYEEEGEEEGEDVAPDDEERTEDVSSEDEEAEAEDEPSEEDSLTFASEDEIEEGNEASSHAVLKQQQEQIRAFLRQGLSVEEISQRLGLGLGAIELIRHIEKRTQETKNQAAQEE